ncbi:SAM-dependent methyltransferase [Sphingomonas quercus]|uniref:Cyclopropane-fatty-acyl-phospholipid synthase family protein n=1 Tax=Sphingomonas quercus TaxID=2842451 RepID=A0ABS6BQ60_9SPHN|nr:cyclopropane-fatty-acyl-phospholipid synthase family protein [Sphingomonas quercus]MBU3079404.1 cyclopropane-fatty-acyl-phospholipid synthase family protein [Sphingomonas quercus]
MHAPVHRGHHLLRAGRLFATGEGWLARLVAPGFRRLLDRIDAGLAEGAIDLTLPEGSRRRLGGRRAGPVADVELKDWRALVRLAVGGSVGWYEAWEKGEWTSPDPVPLFDLFMRNRHTLGGAGRSRGVVRWLNRRLTALRRNDRAGARRNIAFHYDLGNDFYAAWLDPSMTYSSAVWSAGDDLEAAQHRKIDLLLDRLELAAGDRLLEIGCGWGGLAERAAGRGADVLGITLSEEQKAFAEARLAGTGAVIELVDYRDVAGRFDAVASVEMVEAVGEEYWPAYLGTIARVLKPGGRAAIQFISIDDTIFEAYAANADFIQTYIFPGGLLISESRFRAIAGRLGLSWQDRRGFGPDYAETLKQWRVRFDAAAAAGKLPAGFDARFVRLWRYYLMYCEGGFRGGGIDVAQVTLVKN